MNRALVLVVASCGGGSSAVPLGQRIGPAIDAALAAADHLQTPWRCAAPDGPTMSDEKLTIGERTWVVTGHGMRLEGKRDVVIGAIADAGGAAPATLAALGRIRAAFARADLVISLGGIGTTQQELEATLGVLADKAPFAIVALPGDLESATAQTAAIKAMRARGQIVIDGRLARQIELPGVTIATIPGAGAVGRLVAGGEGCGYREADVTAAFTELTAHPSLRILATAEAPRTQQDGEPSGMLALTAGAGQQVDIALHGPIDEPASRARAGDRGGAAVPLTPGTLDATPRLPGPAHVPTAGLLTVHGTSWTWKPIADGE